MPIKRVAHRSKMAKKGTKKQTLGWIPSSFDETDLKKVKNKGFLSESEEIIFPRDEVVPALRAGYRVMFVAFLLRGLSLPTNSFVGFSLCMACSYISSRQILYYTLLASSLSMKHSWASTPTGFFGSTPSDPYYSSLIWMYLLLKYI
jgi:hypothetical protein